MSHYDVDTESIRTDMLSVASSPSNASTTTLTTVAADDPPPYSLVDDVNSRHMTSHDPRSSSTQSLGQHDAPPPETKRVLLLVYIHGFMGAETSFQSYPAHVHNLVSVLLADSHVISTKIYPRYRSRKAIQVATNDFSAWLAPHESSETDVILVGHSLGGILAAEVALLPTYPYDFDRPLRHRILGTICFDTPFLGMHPGVVKSGLGSIFRPGPSPPRSPNLSPTPSQASTSNASLSSTPPRVDTFTNTQPADPNFNPPFSNDILLPVRTGWKNAQHFVQKHSNNLVSATSSLIKSHLEFGGCLADYEGLKGRYCRIRLLEEENPQLRATVIAGNRPPHRIRFVNYYTASTGRGKASLAQIQKAAQSHQPPLPAYRSELSFTSTSTPSIASTELPPYESELGDPEDDDDSDLSDDELSDFDDGSRGSIADSNFTDPDNASVKPPLPAGESSLPLPPLPQAPKVPVGPSFPSEADYDRDAYRDSLKEYYQSMKHYHDDLKKYHRALRKYRKAERKELKRSRKESLHAMKQEVRRIALAEHYEGKLEDKKQATDSLKDEHKRLASLHHDERKRDKELRQAELKERVDLYKEARKHEIDRRKTEHKAWQKQIKEDRKAAWDAVKSDHKTKMDALKDSTKANGKSAQCPRDVRREAKKTKKSTEQGPTTPLSSTSQEDQPRPSSDSLSLPQGPFLKDEKGNPLPSQSTLPLPKDKKFCNLPPKDAAGNRDPTWVRVYMEGVDEVGAHCGLFFPDSAVAGENPNGEWGERYARLVGDVSERIETWVQESLSEALVRSESERAAAEMAAAPPLPPRRSQTQESGVMMTP